MSNSKNDSKNVSKENNEKKYKIEDIENTFGNIITTLNDGVKSYLTIANDIIPNTKEEVQKGGVRIRQDLSPEEAFNSFLDRASARRIGNPSWAGVLFELIFNGNPDESPYTPYNTATLREVAGMAAAIQNQRTHLCVKIVNIATSPAIEAANRYGYHFDGPGSPPYKLELDNAFKEEIRVQQEIAIKTSEDFEAATPYVVFGGVYDKSSRFAQKIGRLLSTVRLRPHFPVDGIQYAEWNAQVNNDAWFAHGTARQASNRIGIVVMQVAGGYNLVNDPHYFREAPQGNIAHGWPVTRATPLNPRPPLVRYVLTTGPDAYQGELQKVLYEIIRIAVKTGIVNLDSHYENILNVNTSDRGRYIRNPVVHNRALLIDWGNWIRLTPVERAQLQNHWDNPNVNDSWQNMLSILRKAVANHLARPLPAGQNLRNGGGNTLDYCLGHSSAGVANARPQLFDYLRRYHVARQQTIQYYLNPTTVNSHILNGVNAAGGITLYAGYYAYNPNDGNRQGQPPPNPIQPPAQRPCIPTTYRDCHEYRSVYNAAFDRAVANGADQAAASAAAKEAAEKEDTFAIEPITHERLIDIPLNDLVILPSDNCIKASSYVQLRNTLDPLTQTPLPANWVTRCGQPARVRGQELLIEEALVQQQADRAQQQAQWRATAQATAQAAARRVAAGAIATEQLVQQLWIASVLRGRELILYFGRRIGDQLDDIAYGVTTGSLIRPIAGPAPPIRSGLPWVARGPRRVAAAEARVVRERDTAATLIERHTRGRRGRRVAAATRVAADAEAARVARVAAAAEVARVARVAAEAEAAEAARVARVAAAAEVAGAARVARVAAEAEAAAERQRRAQATAAAAERRRRQQAIAALQAEIDARDQDIQNLRDQITSDKANNILDGGKRRRKSHKKLRHKYKSIRYKVYKLSLPRSKKFRKNRKNRHTKKY